MKTHDKVLALPDTSVPALLVYLTLGMLDAVSLGLSIESVGLADLAEPGIWQTMVDRLPAATIRTLCSMDAWPQLPQTTVDERMSELRTQLESTARTLTQERIAETASLGMPARRVLQFAWYPSLHEHHELLRQLVAGDIGDRPFAAMWSTFVQTSHVERLLSTITRTLNEVTTAVDEYTAATDIFSEDYARAREQLRRQALSAYMELSPIVAG